MKLAQEVTAPRLGEGRVTNLASQLIASAKLPNRTGSLPLSSRDRRSYGGYSPEASHRAFCLGLHICLGSEDLGSQGTSGGWEELGRGSSSYLPGYNWLLLRSLDHRDLSVLPSAKNWTTLREQFFEFFLVETNDQVFEMTNSRLWSLHCDTVSLLRQTNFPSGVAILFFIEKLIQRKLTKRDRGAKL